MQKQPQADCFCIAAANYMFFSKLTNFHFDFVEFYTLANIFPRAYLVG